MNGYTKIQIGEQLVPLLFGFLANKWFTLSVAENRDFYYEGDSLSFLGISELLHCGYRNQCAIEKKEAAISLMEFNEWVEQSIENPERAKELAEVLNVWADSRFTKLLVSKMEAQEDEGAKKKTPKKPLKK